MALPRPPPLPLLFLPDTGDDSLGLFGTSPQIPSQTGKRRSRKPPQPPDPSAPQHPIPTMQDAFEESLIEATTEVSLERPKLRIGDAKSRWEQLVHENGGSRYLEAGWALWRRRPDQKHHELWRLLAQIAFGVYLLLTGQANSEQQVFGILQRHIDDVDEFLEVVMEDLEHAVDDLSDRLALLQLPIQNVEVFERMLEDRNFRFQIVSGNEKIERILMLTRRSLEEMVKDVATGLDATQEFAIYLRKQEYGMWRRERPGVADIFTAMEGNVEGWLNAFMELQSKQQHMGGLMVRLGKIVSDIDCKAGEVSRRTRFSINPYSWPESDPQSGNTTLRGSIVVSKTASPTATDVTCHVPDASPRESTGWLTAASSAILRNGSKRSSSSVDSEETVTRRNLPEFLTAFSSSNRLSVRDSGDIYDCKVPLCDIPDVGSGPMDTTHEREEVLDGELAVKVDDSTARGESTYILQPRTYSPRVHAPMPSPKRFHHPHTATSPVRPARDDQTPRKRASLRDRVSQKTQPPDSIQVPPPNALEFQQPIRPSPQPTLTYPAPDSAYGSDVERRRTINSIVADPAASQFSPSLIRPGLTPSPRSEQQRYFPVQASPHSPLQQRPWTAGESTVLPPRAATSQNHCQNCHIRNQPSQMNMSMLSHVMSASDLQSEVGKSVAPRKQLKKKKSAFGWLKNAFLLNEEERAAYEQRRQQPVPRPYTEASSPRYLDGKRIA